MLSELGVTRLRTMAKAFVLTIDVEIDAGKKWRTSNPASYDGVHAGIAKLQSVCDPYGVKPVYLISPAVMVDARSVEYLNSLGPDRCELGAHLHGKTSDPAPSFSAPILARATPGKCNVSTTKCSSTPS